MAQLENPLIIDVEASGFGAFSYPIEIGIAMGGDQKYCTLILPAPDWTHWDESAEKIHRVPRDILETYGKPMADVTKQLNELLRGKTVYTDGWVVDKPWLTTLFHTARVQMEFFVSPLEMILSEPQMNSWHQTKDTVIAEMNLARHRASYDAVIIQETYKRTLDASDD
ncbi:MAG: hypothetical protein KUG52_07180 [Immundisolibacteraceae bacterium]|nr:hypothetical protein [Immundisolibacteraceae bacterium]